MKELKSLYEEAGFQNVRTYIQSGNVLFEHPPTNAKELSKVIEKKITEKYSFDVPVIIRTMEELDKIRNQNPFLQKADVPAEHLYVTFLADEPTQAAIDKLQAISFEPHEYYVVSGKEVYLHCPNGYGKSKLINTFFEGKLKVLATNRNWKTVNTLAEMAKAAS